MPLCRVICFHKLNENPVHFIRNLFYPNGMTKTGHFYHSLPISLRAGNLRLVIYHTNQTQAFRIPKHGRSTYNVFSRISNFLIPKPVRIREQICYWDNFDLFLDDDHQLVLPEAFRELFEDGAYVTRGFEQNLLLMSEKEFQEIYTRVAGLNIADPLARLLHRLILGNAAKLR